MHSTDLCTARISSTAEYAKYKRLPWTSAALSAQWLGYEQRDSGFESRQGQGFISRGPDRLSVLEHKAASQSVGNGDRSLEQRGRSVNLTIQLHLLQRVRMSGGIPAIPLYPLMARRWTTLPFTEVTHRLAFPSSAFNLNTQHFESCLYFSHQVK